MLHPERRAILFQTILDSMGESVLVVDTIGKEIYANAELRRFRGKVDPNQDKDEWRKPARMQIFDAQWRELDFQDWPLARALRGDFRRDFEIWVKGMAHRPETLLSISTTSLISPDGEIQGAVAVTRDITEVRQIEEKLRQSQKLETIGQLTGGIAHDFNNSLAAIQSSVELLKMRVADDASAALAIATIEASAKHGADLARRLLAFARKQPLLPTATEVNALVEEMLLLLRPTLPAQMFVAFNASAQPIHANVDATELTAALLNLCVNARDAMGNAGDLSLKVEPLAAPAFKSGSTAPLPPGPYVRITVDDTGPGMSEDVRKRAIDPFFTTKTKQGGTGLGLSTVYGFIQQSGGAMHIASDVGRGARIELLLPSCPAPPLEAKAAAPERPRKQFKTVLVVDDNHLVRDAARMLFECNGFEVAAAANASDALALIEEKPVDLLVTDVMMPGDMNGLELAAAAASRLKDLSIILCTGYADAKIDFRAFYGRPCALLRKPFNVDELMNAIAEVS